MIKGALSLRRCALYLRTVPNGAIKCGAGTFNVEGPANAASAQLLLRMSPHFCEKQVMDVILKRMNGDLGLVEAANQMDDMKTGYTIDGPPVEVKSGTWSIPFTAYLFDASSAR
jgi:hypothetical protein